MTFGWLSLLPPLVAIVLAIVTRRVIVSLAIGIGIGGLILVRGNLFALPHEVLIDHLGANLVDREHLQVFAFTLLMGAMVGVLYRGGGMDGVVRRIAPWASNRRRGQITTWLLGLVIFFDDYANTLLLGGTMRPLADRLKISREKLAYLVDSTAAPVAGLALVSTWVAGEIGFIAAGLAGAAMADAASGFAVFVATIPYRFYVLLALVFVPLVAWTGRDFGPMLRAERRMHGHRDVLPDRTLLVDDPLAPHDATPRRAVNALFPITLVVLGVAIVLMVTGAAELRQASASIGALIAAGNSYLALVVGSAAGLIAALLLTAAQRLLSPSQLLGAVLHGARLMLPALAILLLAWTLASMTTENELGTGAYLASLIGDRLPVEWMPTVVFVLSGVIAFSTGTSWGTMSLVMPLAIPVMCDLLASANGSLPTTDSPLLLATIGSVLAGAIFGDHCSPISDTTILSSQASGCDHAAHVSTQMPYAMVVAGAAILFGTLPSGYGIPVWVSLAVGPIALLAWLRLVGRRAEDLVMETSDAAAVN